MTAWNASRYRELSRECRRNAALIAAPIGAELYRIAEHYDTKANALENASRNYARCL